MNIIKLTEDSLILIRETQGITHCWECKAPTDGFYLCDKCDLKVDKEVDERQQDGF